MLRAIAVVRAEIPPLGDDRLLAPDLAAASAMVASGRLAEAAGVDVLPGLDAKGAA